MARTKQTSKRNVGDKPGRVSLVNLQAKEQQAAQAANANAIRAPLQVKKRRIRNSFCLMCRDGGTLWECDVMGCWRVVCNKCLVVPEDSLQQITQPGVSFRYIHPPPYFITSSPFVSPQGFYLGDEHVLSKPPAVMGTFQHATTSEVATLSTTIIHLHLDGLTLDPDPVHIIQSMIQGYFKQEGTYNFAQLPYDLGTQESRAAYETAAEVLSSFLAPYGRVVLFFTTHSEEQSGDLFAGSRDGQVFVSRVFEVLEALLTPLSKIVEGGDLIFLVCGYLVKHQESFQDFKSAMNHFKPRSMLLFDADRLLPVNTIPFLMSVLDLTIIQSFQQMDKTVKAAPKDCGVLGRHSNIILMFWGSQGGRVLVERYIWTDKFIKPWGQNLPAQCPQCGSMQEWLAASADSTYSYQCQYPDCGKDLEGAALPPKTYTISMPQGAKKLLDGKQSSAWLVEIL
ncbi:hypothetical protein F5J12DRAFT_784932 [Pisolithus orientalis]|uniref:uncharacterized protein n=1 Tax=Pisolithus orientalis TaxID=936130 RepID=UPI0022251EE3|nr:uncharacterized protein F5J12DRAFT_784932 [Pisolithus orientalis]KAI5998348.1 hypothetical protein F5J12DRAFT_784932 [Pisolithus orientalis]